MLNLRPKWPFYYFKYEKYIFRKKRLSERLFQSLKTISVSLDYSSVRTMNRHEKAYSNIINVLKNFYAGTFCLCCLLNFFKQRKLLLYLCWVLVIFMRNVELRFTRRWMIRKSAGGRKSPMSSGEAELLNLNMLFSSE